MKLPTLHKRTNLLKHGNDPAWMYLNSLKASGRRSMGILLTKVASLFGYITLEAMPWENVRYEHLTAVKSMLRTLESKHGHKYSISSINMTIYAMRGIAKTAYKLRLISSDDLIQLNAVKPLGIEHLSARRAIEHDEFDSLLAVCQDDNRPAGVRDLAIIHCLYIAGLRRAETAKLTLDNYMVRKHEKSGERRAEFRFIGKGQNEAVCHLDDETLSAMDAWLVVRGREPGPLFCAISKWEKLNLQRHMSDQAIYNIVINRSKQAGIPQVSPQDIRRTLAIELLNTKKVPINRVQNILRHADIRTTATYVGDRGDENRKIITGLRNRS